MVPPLDPNSRTAVSLENTLGRSLADDILAQYIVQVQNEIGVTVNDTVLRQVIGGTGDVY
jgi:peptidyl-prolyl cis-trans isomerase D